MKIAVLVYGLDGIGGVAKHTLYLSREFTAMGHEVAVWCVEYDRHKCYPELTEGLNIQTLRPVPSVTVGGTQKVPGIRLLANMWSLWKFHRDQHKLSLAVPRGYDVVNAHGNMTSWAAAEYKLRHGTPVVWMCNDFVPVASHRYEVVSTGGDEIRQAVKKSLSFPFERHDRAAVCGIDKIAVLSEQVASQMKEHYGVEPIVVRKGVDSWRFAQGDSERVRGQHRLPHGSFLVLTVGSLMPRRRLEDVVRAIRILVEQGLDVAYLVVGRTSHSPDYAEFVQAEVAGCNLGDRVKLVGEVSEEELVDLYQACDAFVWASDERQSWGSAGMEAMAARKPIIVSRANGLAEVLEDGKTALLVPPRSSEAIADAIKRLMRDPALADSLAMQGQRLMRERHSWRTYAETMLALFRETIDKA